MSMQPQNVEMDLGAAINNVCAYLHRQGAVFTLYRAWKENKGFMVTVHQNVPEDKYRAFEVKPGDMADVWNVTETSIQEVQ